MTKQDNILKQQFEQVFNEYFTGLVYFAMKYLDDEEASKDVVHTVFIKLWENRHEFAFDKSAKSYLFTSVYNRSLNVLRDNKKFQRSDDEEQHERLMDGQDFTDTMEVSELERSIQQALSKLPERCRQVFELSRFEGKKYQEIADELNISVKTVEGQMSKALKVLKTELKDYIYVLLALIINNDIFG